MKGRGVLLAAVAAVLGASAIIGVEVSGGTGSHHAHNHAHGAGRSGAGAAGAITLSSVNDTVNFGGTGNDLWAVTGTGTLYVSSNGGTSWTSSIPPVSLTRLRSPEYAVSAGQRTVLLVAPDNGQETVFTSATRGEHWSGGYTLRPYATTQGTTPAFPPGADEVSVQRTATTTIHVSFDQFLQATQARSTLETSTDGGASFTPSRLPTFGAVQFTSASDGVLVGGPGQQHIFETTNGGSSWQALGFAAPSTADFSIGFPLSVTGATVTLPETVTASAETQLFFVPAGTALARQAVPRAQLPAVGAPLTVPGVSIRPVALSGTGGHALVMAPNGQKWYRTSNSATSWSSGSAQGIPSGTGIAVLVSSGASKAVVEATHGSCTDKQQCTYRSSLYATDDGGAVWSPVRL